MARYGLDVYVLQYVILKKNWVSFKRDNKMEGVWWWPYVG